MKNSIKIAAAIAFFGFAGSAMAQNTSSTTGDAQVLLASPIHLTQFQNLDFGTAVQGNGTVTLASSSATSATYTGNVAPGSFGLAMHAAEFIVTGQNWWTYHVTTPATVTVSDGTNSAVVTLGTPVDINAAGFSLNGTGNGGFWLGGTLTLDGSQQASSTQYTGTYTETVNYN